MQGNTDVATEVFSVSKKRNTQECSLFFSFFLFFFQKRDGAVKVNSYNAICSNIVDLEIAKLNEVRQKKINVMILLTCGI